MEFKANRGEFLELLNIVNKAVSLKPVNEVAGSILISLKKDTESLGRGIVKLTGTNFDCTIMAVGDVIAIEEGEIAVPAKRLTDIVNALPEGVIQFKLDDRFIIKGGKSKFQIICYSPRDFPKPENKKINTGVSINKNDLVKAIKKTIPCINTAYNTGIEGVFIEVDDLSLYATGINGNILGNTSCNINTSTTNIKTNALIAVPFAKNLQQILSSSKQEDVKIGITDMQLIVKQDHFVMIMSLLSATYPPYRRLIPNDDPEPCIISRQLFVDAINRVAIIAIDDVYKGIQLDFSKDKLRIKTILSDNGFSEDEIQIEYNGENKTIYITYTELMKVLGSLNGSVLEIHLNNSKLNIKIVARDDHFIGIVAVCTKR